ncbi:hypothetical protein D0Y65_017081, partial [Glycine soja]
CLVLCCVVALTALTSFKRSHHSSLIFPPKQQKLQHLRIYRFRCSGTNPNTLEFDDLYYNLLLAPLMQLGTGREIITASLISRIQLYNHYTQLIRGGGVEDRNYYTEKGHT